MDATCETTENLNFICSAQFLGFFVGLFLFPLPDQIGRKKTMVMILVPYIFTMGMVTYGTTILQKTIGMFMQGALHLRITLSYTHMYELVRESDKQFCAQIINLSDTMAMAIVGSIFLLVSQDAIAFFKITY